MKGLVVSSGTIKNYETLKSIVNEVDCIICADGGVNHMMKINMRPDLVIGDLDSVSPKALDFIKQNNIQIVKYPAIKDSTDSELAIQYLISKNFTEVSLIGVTGTRQDHGIANIFLLNTLYENKIFGTIIDDNNFIYLVDNTLNLSYIPNMYVSVVPISDEGIIVSLNGFYYNLDREYIKFGSTHGVSNEIIENTAKIHIHQGKALVFHSKD